MPEFNLAIVVGSNRRESINAKLAHALANLADGKLLVNFVQIDDLPCTIRTLRVLCPQASRASRLRSSRPTHC